MGHVMHRKKIARMGREWKCQIVAHYIKIIYNRDRRHRMKD